MLESVAGWLGEGSTSPAVLQMHSVNSSRSAVSEVTLRDTIREPLVVRATSVTELRHTEPEASFSASVLELRSEPNLRRELSVLELLEMPKRTKSYGTREAICIFCRFKMPYSSLEESGPVLIKHIRECHPCILEQHNQDSSTINEVIGEKKERRKRLRRRRSLKERRRRLLYKKSVSDWRPGGYHILCPRCGVESLPEVRRLNTPQVNGQISGMCFGLWPVCWLPYLMMRPSKIKLHCPNCTTQLATYDSQHAKCTPTLPPSTRSRIF